MQLVKLSVSDSGIATITLNDPDRRNAMGLEMSNQFRACIRNLELDTSIRSVILTGAGRAFAAGGDLEMLRTKAALDEQTNRERMLDFYHSFLCILKLPVPVIAAVNGHAIGAGLCLAMACDFRVVANSAKLGFTFTRLGLHPGMGASFFVSRTAGATVAIDLLVSGRVFDAAEGNELGLFHNVCEAEDVVKKADDMATAVLDTGPSAVAGLLETLRPEPRELQVALEREANEQAKCFARPEFIEGVESMIEKRKPRFDAKKKS